jgi:hypothetical protein
MAKYLGSPPCAKVMAGAISSRIATMQPTSAGELVRSNQERMPTPLEEREKSADELSVVWTDEATVKLHARQQEHEKNKPKLCYLTAN